MKSLTIVATVPARIIRSGYAIHAQRALQRYGQQYYQTQMAMAYPSGGGGEPVIEMGGKIQFGLPGKPIFPALPDDSVLKPTLTGKCSRRWKRRSMPNLPTSRAGWPGMRITMWSRHRQETRSILRAG